MKIIAISSVLLNVVLLLLRFIPGKEFGSGGAKLPDSAMARVSGSMPVSNTIMVTNRVVTKLDWRLVESDDYRTYIANLRMIGCPEETIRDIVQADVRRLFQQKLQSAIPATKPYEFWKSNHPFAAAMSPERTSKSREILEEQRAVLTKLLGESGFKDEPMAASNPLFDLLPFLAPGQQQQVSTIRDEFKGEMVAAQNGAGTPDDRRKLLVNAQDTMEQKLSAIMSPDQKEDFDLRLSNTANKMREHLAAFEPTEVEFRSIFRARKQFEDEINHLDITDANAEKTRRGLENRFLQQVESSLPYQRFQEFLNVIHK